MTPYVSVTCLAFATHVPETRRKLVWTSGCRGIFVDELVFLVKGSSAEPYEVTFIKDGNSLTALCTCPAGQYGNFCKHRISILDGNAAAISSENAGDVPKVLAWLSGTDVEAALIELREVENGANADKKNIISAKRKLARAMNS